MTKKTVSIEDVARRAKVSITTVSRVINNVPTVSQKNRLKVEEAIAHLKFKPNVNAQRLARGINNAIGLVMPGYPGIFHSFYAIELIRGVGHACETARLDMIFHITNGFNPLNPHNVGGIVFADVVENRKQVESAMAVGVPCMVINHEVTDLDVGYIAIDNYRGGQLAGEYFTSLKHKRIAVVTGNLNTQAGAKRFEGFKDVCLSNNVSLPNEYVFEGDYSRRCAREAAEKFLECDQLPSAIFACSDDMALELIAAFLERGIKVPEEVSIIGFDDNPSCLFGPVAVTTIRQPLFKMAQDAVRGLSSVIAGKEKKMIRSVLEPELVIRESCAPFRK